MPENKKDHIFYMGQWYTKDEIEVLDKNNL